MFTQASVLNVTPNVLSTVQSPNPGAGIWMSGAALAADASNNIYAVTGNGTFDANSPPSIDYGDSLLQLNDSLGVSQYFTPSNYAVYGTTDQDFGSGGAVVLADLPATSPVTHLIMGGGKNQAVYVLDRDHLGGVGDAFAWQELSLAPSEIFATGAFWNNTFYIAAVGGKLNAYALDPATAKFGAPTSSNAGYGFPGGTPSVSAAGTQSGLVWILDTSQYCTPGAPGSACNPAILHAYDATNMGIELWNSAMVPADKAGNAVKFTVPTIANGKVYVGTRGNNLGGNFGSTTTSGELDVYGLK